MAKTPMSRPSALSKLPKWAQNTIAALERKVSELQEENAFLRGGQEFKGTRVFIHHPCEQDIPLPAESRVMFRLSEEVGDYFQVGFEYAHNLPEGSERRKALVVRCGSGRLAIYPEAANSIHIKTEGI